MSERSVLALVGHIDPPSCALERRRARYRERVAMRWREDLWGARGGGIKPCLLQGGFRVKGNGGSAEGNWCSLGRCRSSRLADTRLRLEGVSTESTA